jgi:hypothetical protein
LILKNLENIPARGFLENWTSKLAGSLSIPCQTLISWEDKCMDCGASQKLAPPKLPNGDAVADTSPSFGGFASRTGPQPAPPTEAGTFTISRNRMTHKNQLFNKMISREARKVSMSEDKNNPASLRNE